MHITIHTNLPIFGYRFAQFLEGQGHEKILVLRTEKEECLLLHSPRVDSGSVCSFLSTLQPFEITPAQSDDLEEDFRIILGFPASFSDLEMELHGDSLQIIDRLHNEVAVPLGALVVLSEQRVVSKNVLQHRNIPPALVQLLRWWLLQSGFRVSLQDLPKTETSGFCFDEPDFGSRPSAFFPEAAEKEPEFVLDDSVFAPFSFSDDPCSEPGPLTDSVAVIIKVTDLEQKDKPLRQRVPITIRTDSDADGNALATHLCAHGFRVDEILPLALEQAVTSSVEIKSAWHEILPAQKELTELQELVRQYLLRTGFDLERFPVLRAGKGELPFSINLTLPLSACRSGRRLAYAGSFPERFKINLYIDDDPLPWVERLNSAGFVSVVVNEFNAKDLFNGFRVVQKESKGDLAMLQLMKAVIDKALQEEADKPVALSVYDNSSVNEAVFDLYLPIRALKDGRFEEERMSPGHYSLTLHCEERSPWDELVDDLRVWSFHEFKIKSEDVQPAIHYGGAPKQLIDKIKKLFVEKYAVILPAEKKWSDNDNDIWIYVPRAPFAQSPSPPSSFNQAHHLQEQWLNQSVCNLSSEQLVNRGTFLESMDGHLAVGDLLLECAEDTSHPLVPCRDDFAHFCIDFGTAKLLHHLATCVLLKESCLLEGETSTSKTSSILFLAMLLGQPVVRLNLNQQTDTGDLLGRFVPETSASDGQSLGWRWQDGLLVQAMVNGWWFIFDEINLWPPDVAEGINSVLEKEPSLVLKEYDNSVIGAGGRAVHPRFRAFSTMNPADYSGRMRLSPAFKDRWLGYRFVETPGEEEYLAMLRLLVFGHHPEVSHGGLQYKGCQAEPVFTALTNVDGIDNVLEALARLHSALEQAARPGPNHQGLGQGGKESYTVTRRSLLNIVEYMASPAVSGGTPTQGRLRHALCRYYMGRARRDDDRALISQLLDSVGLGPTTWQV